MCIVLNAYSKKFSLRFYTHVSAPLFKMEYKMYPMILLLCRGMRQPGIFVSPQFFAWALDSPP